MAKKFGLFRISGFYEGFAFARGGVGMPSSSLPKTSQHGPKPVTSWLREGSTVLPITVDYVAYVLEIKRTNLMAFFSDVRWTRRLAKLNGPSIGWTGWVC